MVRRALLDTGAAGEYAFQREPCTTRVKEAVKRGMRIGICTPVLGELLAGMEISHSRDRNLPKLRRSLKALPIWPFDSAAAAEYGRLFAALKLMGRPMQQIDIQIAAIALALGNTIVVSGDSDLAAVPRLTVENWSVP
jgi:predicted nucleic acid-binding protein